jgi:MinD-like ATPase involved in chromosome partitioning or flagellar assembly
MKLLGVGLEPNAIKAITDMGQVTYTRTLNNVSELMGSEWLNVTALSWDFILLGDLYHSDMPAWEWLHRLRTHFATVPIIIFWNDHEDPYETLLTKRLAERYGLLLTPCQLTTLEMVDYLEQLMGACRENSSFQREFLSPLIVGWGVSPKVGVTSILSSAAISLAKRSDLKVGVLDLNFRSPEMRDLLGLSHSVKDFLLIQSDLSSNLLVPQALQNVMVRKKELKNVSFLLASPRREYAGLITKDEIDILLRVARSAFDVVFVDVNSYPDNAATLRAVKQATERWVITDPSIQTFQSSWRDWYENVFQLYGLGLDDFQLIVNKNHSQQLYSSQLISKTMCLRLIGELPDMGHSDRFREEIFNQMLITQNTWSDSIQSILGEFTMRMGWNDGQETKTPMSWIQQVKVKMKEIRGVM